MAESHTFRERVYRWQISPKFSPRTYVILNLSFAETRKWFIVKPYNFTTNQGEQRELIPSWVNKLKREMLSNNFTPTMWSGSIRKSHFDKAVFHDDDTVSLSVSTVAPFAHIDGNHRGAAMLKILVEADKVVNNEKSTVADREAAQGTIDLVNSCSISILLHLDYAKIRANFIKHQEGRPVNKGQTRVMKMRNKDVPEEKLPVSEIALKVAFSLNDHKDSHIYGQLATGSSTTNKIGFDNLTVDSASEMSCSVFGGAEIAVHFGKDAAWLLQCYIDAFRAIETETEAVIVDGDREVPNVLKRGKVLCPLGRYDGTRGGSTLIIGIGNMYAWWRGFTNANKEANPADLAMLATCVDTVFGDEGSEGGLDGPRKRLLMGDFARELFKDIVLGEEETPKQGKVHGVEGVPTPLLTLIRPSAFGIRKKQMDLTLPEDDINMFGVPDEDDEEHLPANVKVKGKNRKHLAKIHHV